MQNGLSFVRTDSKSATVAEGKEAPDAVLPKPDYSTSVTKVKAHFPSKQGKEGCLEIGEANKEGAATGRPDARLTLL